MRGSQWYSERQVQYIRKKVRTQNLWLLHLSGDWHSSFETMPLGCRETHMMRCMLVSNLDVQQAFANGTQGRVVYWHPGATEHNRHALPASHPELLCRFVKGSSMHKQELFPDIDMIDVSARQENLAVRGEPILLQLPVTPAYALTIHKTQSLSMKCIVRGCLEDTALFPLPTPTPIHC